MYGTAFTRKAGNSYRECGFQRLLQVACAAIEFRQGHGGHAKGSLFRKIAPGLPRERTGRVSRHMVSHQTFSRPGDQEIAE